MIGSSEDILKDSRKSFENGLPIDGSDTNIDTTAWGRVPSIQSLVNAFDNDDGARENQDLGYDGLNDADEIIFNVMSKLLGTEFFCGSYCASRLLPGSLGQELHLDYPYWDFYKSETFPIGLNSSFAQNCQVTIPLDICSKESGATAYIPGSQKNLHYPTQKDDLTNKQQMIAEPGDLVFFNGNCWHGASPNNSDYQRAALLIEFLPKYIKPVEDLVSYLDKDFKDNSSDRVRQLLGLNYEYPKIMDSSKKLNNIGIGYKTK